MAEIVDMKDIFKILEDNPPKAGDVLKSYLYHIGISQYKLAKLDHHLKIQS